MMRSHYAIDVTPHLDGKHVSLAGWVHETRDLGGLLFIVLRDRSGLIQITLKKKEADPDLVKIASHLVKEAAIVCEGVVKASKIASGGREVIPEEITVVGEVLKTVPFEVTGKVPADLDVRLDHRSIDLRRFETSAIFKIRHFLQKAFREKLCELTFREITPPCVVSTSTEGGADLFSVKYFEKNAFLAQSPQLYKQLAVIGGMDKVFMITPVFRAEKHNTLLHLNECTQMDAEMGFADDNDALDVMEKTVLHILSEVKKNCSDELALLKADFKVPHEIPRFSYDEIVNALGKKGVKMNWGDDFSKENEEKIPAAIGEELFIIRDWPTQARAFYSMPREENPDVCKAYDLVFKGLEIASGAQRIHTPELLVAQLKARGLKPENFEDYVDAFRFGSIPHAGWSIGVERLLMKLTNRENIRECALFPRDRHRLTP
ncbi:MAG: aspartate--tRNA(Asn) ligase [Candidatus Micrarchaeota archaeon]